MCIYAYICTYTHTIEENSYEVLWNIIHLSCYIGSSFAYVYIYILYVLIHMNYISSCVLIYPYYVYHITFYRN